MQRGQSAAKRTASADGDRRLPSIASSEYYSRLEALELQLQEERKRRVNVEKTIQFLKEEQKDDRRTSGQAMSRSDLPVNPQSVLTELSLFLHQQRGGSSSRGSQRSAASSRRAAADGSTGRPPVQDIPTSASAQKPPRQPPVPRPPLLCSRQAVDSSATLWSVERHVKPQLPSQAKGCRNCDATPNRFARKRTSDVEVYLTQQRHDQRMQHLANFQLTPF
ncbi:Hypothetical protein, putative [Bodo saltans]|uniref:Uncharacterized protein n=1 Tax=Bodo saltans TaxID=75058 RepID=A0A0S4JN34_BODSA|nr:Hypothetical protein, putative [Bodo saltans]|eukprot:CUG91636.1 Hypothetical protein, putative [Bodo saltans]